MRKVTGYIGALIVVVALMGSVLAGYALNINGQSVVVNEYENVTDVSGLYSHTDEKTYIDYNPASNYIGYRIDQSDSFTIDNHNGLSSGVKYQVHTSPVTGRWSDDQYSDGAYYGADGNVVPYSTSGLNTSVPVYRIATGENFTAYRWMGGGAGAELELRIYNNGTIERYWAYDFNFNFNGASVSITFNNQTKTTVSSWFIAPSAIGDYVVVYGQPGYYQTGLYRTFESNAVIQQVTEWDGKPVFNFYSITTTNADAFVPATVTYQPLTSEMGIDYTESNRVNNYPVGVDGETTNSVTNTTINLEQISVTDYAQPTDYYWTLGTIVPTDSNNTDHYITVTSPYTTYSNGSYHVTGGVHIYRLTDILSTISIPAGATHIYITAPYSLIQASGKYTFQGTETYSFYLPDNFLIFTNNTIVDEPNKQIFSLPNQVGGYADYNVSTGLVDVYWANGVKVNTGSPDSIYVQYCSSNSTSGNTYQYGTQQLSYTTSSRPAPHLDLTIYSSASSITPHYMDITKGISIKNTNISDSIWNNGYENGQIDILFRAENPNQTYHNELTIVNNTVSINYSGGMFNVAINNGEPVNIGTWRNIILHIDLVDGKISVRPVRTFNSYSNVIMDNTSIEVGDMVGAAPTTTIAWKPTPNSFRFNIYSTSVFMNTYGVVMINPTLDITNYFPNLNRFYKLALHNFSVYGDSITVNGETGTVTNNIITFGEDSFIMRDLSIIYADGHAYIEDSHASKDLGEITTTDVSMAGIWYFETELYSGYTATKQIYTWDWESFILDNTQFCVFYIGLALIGLVVSRRFCIMTVIDYAVLITSIIIALSTQVIA